MVQNGYGYLWVGRQKGRGGLSGDPISTSWPESGANEGKTLKISPWLVLFSYRNMNHDDLFTINLELESVSRFYLEVK